eukprot:5810888-Prymnesium_polylepis.1
MRTSKGAPHPQPPPACILHLSSSHSTLYRDTQLETRARKGRVCPRVTSHSGHRRAADLLGACAERRSTHRSPRTQRITRHARSRNER